jgi:Zn-dependent protease with chaperone function
MFTNLLPLILVLILINMSPATLSEGETTFFSPGLSFIICMGIYAVLLILIYLQNKYLLPISKRAKNALLYLVNAELLIFLFIYHFVFSAQRFIAQLPIFADTSIALFSLLMYLGGLIVFHRTSSSTQEASSELRLLAPLALPFILLVFFVDLLQLFPTQALFQGEPTLITEISFLVITLIFLGLLMVFLPYFLQKIWKCRPLYDPVLEARLEDICRKANFKHAGLKLWSVLDNSLTAAIIGVVPKFRYILFTKRLLREVPTTSVEAILAHEIGHSHYKHLLIYPFIFFGMAAVLSLFSNFISLPFLQYLSLQEHLNPSLPWNTLLYPLAVFVPYALVVWLYFRYVFGLFSRLFERQADLFVFPLQIPPHYMVEALDYVGVATGNTHHLANWHHYGIQERIDFLEKAIKNPTEVPKHNRRVRNYLIAYFVLFAIAVLTLVFF